jgi:hypothetical protein
MIGQQLLSASNMLDLLVQSGDWKRDERLKQATTQLVRALNTANNLPELKTAYETVVNTYYACTSQEGVPHQA